MSYPDALAWLYGTQLHGIKLGLRNIRRLLKELRVQVNNEGEPWYVHVAGTNGKGSVCAMLDAILRAAGRRTGLFTSPHLVDFRERIKHNGKMIPEPEVTARIAQIRDLVAGWDQCPTFFEITTAIALGWFQDVGTEVAILETGMGGRFDATNVVKPAVSVITPIYLDHQEWLGQTLPEIALEKAGIIKQGVPVISAWQREEVLAIIGHIAMHRDAPLHLVISPMGGLEIGLAGKYQRWNAALAVHTLQLTRLRVPDEAVIAGLRDVRWPGRFEQVTPRLVIDGAHNPAAARCLAQTWREVYGEQRATVVFSALADKDISGMCRALLPIAARFVTVPVRNARSRTAEDLRIHCQNLAPEIPCTAAPDISSALKIAQESPEPVLVTGSLFLIGDAITHLQNLPSAEASAQ
jgi:dihydrofolate synthase / folylpolyglutamate synthase